MPAIGGAPGTYLFSTWLKCGVCGSSYTMNGKTHYGCAARSNGRKRFCTNTLTVNRSTVESVLLADIKQHLLSPAAIAEVVRRTKRLTEAAQARNADDSRIGSLRREIANLTDAIASGLLGSSPALAERLQRAEAERVRPSQDGTHLEAAVPEFPDKLFEIAAGSGRNIHELQNVVAGARNLTKLLVR